jgi:hypothetical protein
VVLTTDNTIYIFIALAVLIISVAIFVFALSVKMARMKVNKEIGLIKAHWKYRPARPAKQYKIRD